MSRYTLLALTLGLLLVSAPLCRADDDSYEEPEDDDAPAASGEDSEKDVLVLTTKNFDETIKKHKFVLAEFYAPWCGHCKSLAPHYAKAATALKSYEGDVVLAKIDATVETELGTRFGVQGYPTLKWFVDGDMTDYNGPRESDGIIAWIKKKSGPATTPIDDAAKLEALEATTPAIMVGYFTKPEGAEYDAFKTAAAKVEDVLFVETTSKDVAAKAGLTKVGTATIIKNFKGEERATLSFPSALKDAADEIRTFASAEKMPLILEFNQDNSEKIFNSGVKQQVLLWGGAKDLEAGSATFDAFKAVAAQFKGKLIFVTVNNEGASHEPVTNFFGLKEAVAPKVVGFFMEKNKKYSMSGDVTEATLKTFAASVLDGTAPVEYKSAAIPEDNKDADVTIVVGKTVESIFFDEKKDVLLEVYAPWCGHCKSLEPTYKKLAKRFKKVESVVIAKMDGTENEHPDLEVKGFPTIFFKPAGSREFVTFDEQDRSLKGFTKYLKEHAKVPYTLPKKEAKDEEDAAAPAKEAKDEL